MISIILGFINSVMLLLNLPTALAGSQLSMFACGVSATAAAACFLIGILELLE